MTSLRLALLGLSFTATSLFLGHANRPERVPLRAPLTSFPLRVGGWTARTAPDFDANVVSALGVDEYVNRFYVSDNAFAHVYIGYYRSQHEGSSMHSPMNCLPGAGWAPIETAHVTLRATASSPAVIVNRVLIQKGTDKQVVLYWYQSHGRTIASEYWSKIFLVLDAIRLNRSDAAMVRVIAPIRAGDGGDAAADRAAADLAGLLFPLFNRYLPS